MRVNRLLWLGAILLALTPGEARAYLGPGLGMGAIGVALGVVGSILLGIVSVIWYPVKRLLRRFRRRPPAPPAADPPPP